MSLSEKLLKKAGADAALKRGVAAEPYRWLVIESDLLAGEAIVYLRDEKWTEDARAAHPDLVIYAPSEVDSLFAHRENPEFIKAAHRIKKKFGGRVRSDTDDAA
jgi:hypothetical protein